MVKLTDFEKRLSQKVKETTIADADRTIANNQVLDILDTWKNDAPIVLAKWNRPFTTPDELNMQIAARSDRDMPFNKHVAKLNQLAETILLKEKQLNAVNELANADPELKEKGAVAAYKRWRLEVKQEQFEKEIKSATDQLLKQHQKLIMDRQLFVVKLLRTKAMDPEVRAEIFMQYMERQLQEKLQVLSHASDLFKNDIELARQMLDELQKVRKSGENILSNNQIRKFSQMLVAMTKQESTKPGKKSTLFLLHKRLCACANALNEALGRESLLNIKATKTQKDRLKKETPAPDTEHSFVELMSAIKKAEKMASYYEKQKQFFMTEKDQTINMPLQQKWEQVRDGLNKILLDNLNTEKGATAINTHQALIDLQAFAFKKDNQLSQTMPKLSVDDMKRLRGAIRPLQAALEKDVKNNQNYSLMPQGAQLHSEASHLKQLRSIEKMRVRYNSALPDGELKKQINGKITEYLYRLTVYATELAIYEKGMLPEQQEMRSKPPVNGMGEVTPEAQAAHDKKIVELSKVVDAALQKLQTEKAAIEELKVEMKALATVYPSAAWVIAHQKLPAGSSQRLAMESVVESDVKSVLSPKAPLAKKSTELAEQQRRASSAMFSGRGEERDDFVGPQPLPINNVNRPR